jgi:hypothetical protein
VRLEHLLSRDYKKKLGNILKVFFTLAVNSNNIRLKIQSLVAQLVRVLH